jgi:hypothetical protein
MRPKQAEVEAALRASKGLLEPAARALGVGRGNLRQMLKRFARLEAVRQEQRQVMGDFAESKTFELMSEKHWPSIQYYLRLSAKTAATSCPRERRSTRARWRARW